MQGQQQAMAIVGKTDQLHAQRRLVLQVETRGDVAFDRL